MPPKEVEIVRALLDNLNGRKGFDDWWNGIDPEDQEEILQSMYQIVREKMR